MAGRSLRAKDFLLPLLVVFALAICAPLARGQAGLLGAAEKAANSTDSAPATTESGKQPDLVLTATLRPSRVDLNWECHIADVSQFRIERVEHGSHDWKPLDNGTVSAETNYLADSTAKSTDYEYRIVALSDEGDVLATSAPVHPTTNNFLNVFSGGKVTVQDFLDVKVWENSITNLIVGTLAFIPKLLAALILFGIFWLIYRLIRRIVIGSMAKAHVDSSIRDMLGALLRWSIMGFALVIACDQIGIQIAALLTGVSIIGLAIGFAAQETLANFIAGVVIFWDKPFKVGDWIVIDNMFGKVLRVSFRSTRMLNLNGETIVMPNTYMLANRVANHSTHPVIRVEVPISIAYKESIDHARTALLGTVHGDERICKDPPPTVVVSECADSSVDLLLWLWIHDESVEKSVFFEYLEKAKKALDAAQIQIPFPHMQLMLEHTPALAMLRGDSLQTTP
jgi:small conductance mechanosensitive channel